MKLNKLTRYSVRFLLLLTAIVAMSVGYVVNHNRQQLEAVRKLEAAGISVWHEFKGPNTWLHFLKEYSRVQNGYVVAIDDSTNLTKETVGELKALDNLHHVYVLQTGVSLDLTQAKAISLKSILSCDINIRVVEPSTCFIYE